VGIGINECLHIQKQEPFLHPIHWLTPYYYIFSFGCTSKSDYVT
jgi:hypothetical protein